MFRPAISLLVIAPTVSLAAAGSGIDFNRDIRPILSENCFFCHGPDSHERKAGLRLDTYEGATADNGGVRAIDPADLANSEFLLRLTDEDEDSVMPPPESHKALTPAQIQTLTDWVNSGAPYAEHWSFAPVAETSPPPLGKGWARNPVDRFVFEKMVAHGLAPSPEADRTTLLRRATFDLTGLAPTPEEVDTFLADPSPDAYEKAVDRLLASSAYGERMATAWMDIARYGDTSVMHADGVRTMWPWRDWVVDAYNANKPFDQFTVEQLAGDLIPGATLQQKIASGFNRNSASSDEGGAFPEELRVGYAIDRVQATTSTWLGLSVECAQCHDHKYDPISQKEYFEIFAYFNQAADPGLQTRRGNEKPLVTFFPDPELEKRHADARARLSSTDAAIAGHKKTARPRFEAWLATAEPPAITEPPGLAHHFPLDPESGAPFADAVTGKAPVDTTGGGDPDRAIALEKPLPDGREQRGTDFRDTAARIYGSDIAAFGQDDPFTVSAWVYTPDNRNGKAIVSRTERPKAKGKELRGFDVWVENKSVATHIVYRWPKHALKVASETKLKPKTWHHIVVSYDGSREGTGVSIYVDGENTDTYTVKDTLKNTRSSAVPDVPFQIGTRGSSRAIPAGIADIRIYPRVLGPLERDVIGTGKLTEALAATGRTPEQTSWLEELYHSTEEPAYGTLLADRAGVRTEINALKKHQISSMVMGDVKEHRQTYVLDRGSYDSPKMDEPVNPGTPAFLPPLPEGSPKNRLGLARWIVSDENPLTPRVTMNRYWAMFFGRGLVATTADFGNQGSVPTHPALLDWLAADFVASGWDVKRAIRQLVTSATYRQQSHRRNEALARDPENLYLARSPRFRLQGEFIRDAALQASGLLSRKLGGPGVKPYQPAGLWNEVSLDAGVRFVMDSGDKLYRRSLYTYWKRSAPQPAMTTFDAPTREICTIERPRTNTPLQALVTLNDTQFVEAARAFAERIMKDGGTTERERIIFAFRHATARSPDEHEILIVAQALGAQLAAYRGETAKAEALIDTGDSPRDRALDPAEHAAWTNVASLLLNLDETITRG